MHLHLTLFAYRNHAKLYNRLTDCVKQLPSKPRNRFEFAT